MATKRSSKTMTSVSVGQSQAPSNPSSIPASQTRGVSSATLGMRSAVSAVPQGNGVSREAIAGRAYQIWKSGKGGSDLQNWVQAEKELRSGR